MDNNTSRAGANAVPQGHRTLHLTPAVVWNAQRRSREYRPEAFELNWFIHCTDDVGELMNVGNRYYRDDSREYLALTINCNLLSATVIYEDPARMFPHIYGPLDTKAIERVQRVKRDPGGEFIGLAP